MTSAISMRDLQKLSAGGIQALPHAVPIKNRGCAADRLEIASRALTHAVASRNGSTSDAHLLACAWTFDAGIWSHDRGFVGTGWPSWSNANLRHAVGRVSDKHPAHSRFTA
ncbi:PIN domain-containing protein [Methylobacterium mesophilicum]